MSPQPSVPFGLTLIRLETLAKICLELPTERLETIPPADFSQIKKWVVRYAYSDFADRRSYKLATVRNQEISPAIAVVVELLAVLFSMLTFSAGAMVLTHRLQGIFGTPAALAIALLTAAFMGYLLATQATQVITRQQQRRESLGIERGFRCYWRDYHPLNSLRQSCIQAHLSLLKEVENPDLFSQGNLALLFVVLLSLVEYAFCFHVIAEYSPQTDLWLRAIASLLPLLVLWLVAYLQSAWVALPRASADLIYQYERHRFLPEQMTEREAEHLFCLSRAVEFVLQGDPRGRTHHWSMAKLEARIEYYERYKQHLGQEWHDQKTQRCETLRVTLSQLSQTFVRQPGWCDQEFDWYRKQWVAQEKQQLQADLQTDMKLMEQNYQNRLAHCERAIAQARQEYEAADWQVQQSRGTALRQLKPMNLPADPPSAEPSPPSSWLVGGWDAPGF